jgi:hypothetical protein
MEFLQNNWFWIVVLGFFIWMNASGRGCCGPRNHDRGNGEEEQNRQ